MKKKLLALLFSLASLGLVSCGGGNDVASSGASAVSAAAPATTNDASTTASTPTEPKINGQIDERTGVAPALAMSDSSTAIDSQIEFAMSSIVAFLEFNPKAADTVEGVHSFWIQWPEPIPPIAITAAALSLLKIQGIVEIKEIGKQSIWRSVNPNMKPRLSAAGERALLIKSYTKAAGRK